VGECQAGENGGWRARSGGYGAERVWWVQSGLTEGCACSAAQSTTMSKRRKFVADGVFYAELNEFFTRELAEEGYSGVEVRVTPTVTAISTPYTHTTERHRKAMPVEAAEGR